MKTAIFLFVTLTAIFAAMMIRNIKHPKPVLLPGMCDRLVHYTLVFTDGHREDRTKWMDHNVAKNFENSQNNPEIKRMLQDNGITGTINWILEEVPPYDCMKGPK